MHGSFLRCEWRYAAVVAVGLLASALALFPASARAFSITTATGGSAISADDTSTTWTTLTGPTITENSNKEITTGTIIINAPTGFEFNTGANVTATITRDAGSKTCFTFSSTSVTPAASSITFTVSSIDGTGGNPVTTCHVTFSNIQVRPTIGNPLQSGNMTKTGTETGITTNTVLGTLTEVVGAASKLTITQQPSGTASPSTDFTTKPIVAVQDTNGNTRTGDNSTTISRAAVLSTQSCGGTAGSGTLSSTPASGSSVASGLLTYTAMQYSVAESIKICFTSSGLTSALSNTIAVSSASVPSVETGTVTNMSPTGATLFGNVTSDGGSTVTARGFATSTSATFSGSVSTTTVSGTTGTYSGPVLLSSADTVYYYRAYATNANGTGYGATQSFNSGNTSITRKMHLFQGFVFRLISGTMRLFGR